MSESNNQFMHESLNAVYEAALKLSADERELLTALLNQQSGDGWENPAIRQSWLEECEGREQRVRDGKMQTFTADEVHRRLDRILAK